MKNKIYYDVKTKSKASRMFISGALEGTICNKFCITQETFYSWLDEYIKVQILKLKFVVPDNVICNKLRITKTMLDEYVTAHTRQNGKTKWITTICNKNQKNR